MTGKDLNVYTTCFMKMPNRAEQSIISGYYIADLFSFNAEPAVVISYKGSFALYDGLRFVFDFKE